MILDNRRKKLIRDSINNYKFMKEEIEEKLNKNYTVEELQTFLNRFKNMDITNIETDYLDFIWEDLSICIILENNNKRVGKGFEIYDTVGKQFIVEDFLTVEEYEKLLNTSKEQMLKNAILDLKYYEKMNYESSYNECLNEIVRFLKEEF